MKQTIIMIHGMWGSGRYWENYRKYLEAKGYKCITPTLRYHDINPKSAPPKNWEPQAYWIMQLTWRSSSRRPVESQY